MKVIVLGFLGAIGTCMVAVHNFVLAFHEVTIRKHRRRFTIAKVDIL